MIRFDEISISKLNEKRFTNNNEIAKLKKLEEENDWLKKIGDVIMEYSSLKRIFNSPLCTQQSKRYFRLMSEYPIQSWYLAGQLGFHSIQRKVDAYDDATLFDGVEGNPSIADADEKDLINGGYESKIERRLENFRLKEKSLV